MKSYSEEYLNDVIYNQGKLFDYVTITYPEYDTEDFIYAYMNSKTRKAIDEGQVYINTMDYKELFEYFVNSDSYILKKGIALEGFMPEWIGEFYAYYQWFYNIPSSELIKKIPLDFLKKAYHGLHDLDLPLAVEKVGKI